jgi:hypothetical protein
VSAERCEFCGRFGARRLQVPGQYAGRTTITVYECRRCTQRHEDAERERWGQPPVEPEHVPAPTPRIEPADCGDPRCVKLNGWTSHNVDCDPARAK